MRGSYGSRRGWLRSGRASSGVPRRSDVYRFPLRSSAPLARNARVGSLELCSDFFPSLSPAVRAGPCSCAAVVVAIGGFPCDPQLPCSEISKGLARQSCSWRRNQADQMRGDFYITAPDDLLELILSLDIDEGLKPVSRPQRGPIENEDSPFTFVGAWQGGPVDPPSRRRG